MIEQFDPQQMVRSGSAAGSVPGRPRWAADSPRDDCAPPPRPPPAGARRAGRPRADGRARRRASRWTPSAPPARACRASRYTPSTCSRSRPASSHQQVGSRSAGPRTAGRRTANGAAGRAAPVRTRRRISAARAGPMPGNPRTASTGSHVPDPSIRILFQQTPRHPGGRNARRRARARWPAVPPDRASFGSVPVEGAGVRPPRPRTTPRDRAPRALAFHVTSSFPTNNLACAAEKLTDHPGATRQLFFTGRRATAASLRRAARRAAACPPRDLGLSCLGHPPHRRTSVIDSRSAPRTDHRPQVRW